MTVTEAAARLAVRPSRVRALIGSGALEGRRVGSQWVVSAQDLERREELVGAGARSRAMSARTAWAAADLLDGGKASWLTTSERSRLRSRLTHRAGAGWQTYSRWLRSRHTAATRYRIADRDIAELLSADGVVAAGASAASAHGLGLSAAGRADVYADATACARLVDEFFLIRSATGNLVVRTVDGDWHRRTSRDREGRAVAPRLMVAADLLDTDDARSRTAGRDLLDRILAEHAAGRRRKTTGARAAV